MQEKEADVVAPPQEGPLHPSPGLAPALIDGSLAHLQDGSSTATNDSTSVPVRGAILMPNASCPVAHRMNRRFYHLGVERTDLPPRDAASLMDPECVAYMPPVAVGRDPAHEFHRSMEFNASGAPPPKPKYFSDIDRCKHFVLPRGGMDVGPHLINRPSYQLSTGDYPHTSLLKDMLSINVSELSSLRRSRSQNGSYSLGRRCLAESSQGRNTSSPGVDDTLVVDEHGDGEAGSHASSGATPQSHRMWGVAQGSPTKLVGAVRSIDVAKRSSLLEATARTRRLNVLVDRERQLRKLTRMGHPNQVTVYLPQ